MFIKVLIVEDEEIAAERLAKLLKKVDPTIQILDSIDSVNGAVDWLSHNPAPELIFMDIQLADGSSLEIFQRIEVTTPVIFTTAYDEFALQAFKFNSVDYLLKPIKEAELEAAIKKFRDLRSVGAMINMKEVVESLKAAKSHAASPQKRILVKFGQHIRVFEIVNIAYFYTEERVNFLCTFDGIRLPVDHTLDELEHMLDPTKFFRINRQVIANIEAIDQMTAYSKARVKLSLKPPHKTETIVSSERAAEFKDWLLGK